MVAYVTDVENIEHSSSPTTYFWGGRFLDSLENEDTVKEYLFEGYFEIYSDNGLLRGVMNTPGEENDVYEIASFPSGRAMLIKYAPGELYCEGTEEGEVAEKITGPCNNVIRVLCLYTPGGAGQVSNIAATCSLAVDLLNGGVWNTIKDMTQVSYELCGITTTGSWSENGGDMKQSVNSFAGNSYIQHLRNIYRADVVIGLTDVNDSKWWGLARDFGPVNAFSYALVDADRANDRFIFAHEVGHLLGGRHQQHNINPFEYDNTAGPAHGYGIFKNYLVVQKRYNDIQHVRVTTSKTEHVFSHHNLYLHSRQIGDYNTNDVMRVMVDNACTVADFQVDTIVKFMAKLTGPSSASTGNNVTVDVYPVNGFPTYTYEWWVSSNGGSSWTQLSTTTSNFNSQKTVSMPYAPGLIFSVKAKSPFQQDYWVKKTIVNTAYPQVFSNNGPYPSYKTSPAEESGPAELVSSSKLPLMGIHPNPASDELTISLNIPEESFTTPYSVIICDIYGRKLREEKVPTASYNWKYDCSKLPPGTYFVQLAGNTIKDTQKFSITK
jgi:hypothetical protein